MTARRASIEGFPARLRQLIDFHHKGSVTAAAKALGISQPSLRALVNGESTPRTGTLDALADVYSVSRGWLLEGEGKAPSFDEAPSSSEIFEWAAIIRSLDLPPDVRDVMMAFPQTTMAAVHGVMHPNRPLRLGPPGSGEAMTRYRDETGATARAIRDERRVWIKLFRDWIDGAAVAHASKEGGLGWVRSQVIANRDRFARRFTSAPPPPPKPARRKR